MVDTKDPGPEDGRRINVNQRHELRYWSKRFNVPFARLREVVAKVGPEVKNVRQELEPGTDEAPDGA